MEVMRDHADNCVVICSIENLDPMGVHTGDSITVAPAQTLTEDLARELKVLGLMNIQFAIKDEQLYVIEVNPRASRTVPFVSKAIGVPLAKPAAKIMAGEKLVDLGFTKEIIPPHFSVKEAVFPFVRFPGIDIVLGPEM